MNFIYDHKVLLNDGNLFRRVKLCQLENETRIYSIIKETSNQPLNDFIQRYWSEAKEGRIEGWYQYSVPAQRWFHTKFIRKSDDAKIIIQLSINGAFLVHGSPVGKLPQNIITHPNFVSYFRFYSEIRI